MKKIIIVLLTATINLTGCSMFPNAGPLAGKDITEVNQSILDGETTVLELRAVYGDKLTVEKTPQGKAVMNWYKTWSSGITQDSTVLSVLTDKNIVVKHVVLRYKTKTDYSFVSELTDAELKLFIEQGKTTRKEVESKFGYPNDNSFDDKGNQILMYVYFDSSRSQYGWIPNVGGFIEALAGTKDTKVTLLSVSLDDQDKVVSYQLKTTNYHQGIGLLNSSSVEEVK
ncbi:Uncharacterised protein [Buttiauxella agrestis]|uniref:Lipoprotein n=1 Tax=Buttiauxella agrestis TaxID=82977 RepID=A0A381C3L3_9ENTR|nr:hypothetical protein [Buttiauxella agrestis]SUW62494.1 Uncharacterised protein [Buttiauxella agrestis]